MTRVLILYPEAHLQPCFDELRRSFDAEIAAPEAFDLARALPGYDAYLASMACRVTPEMLAAAPRLRVIATPSTGTDHLPREEMAARGIRLISLRDYPEFLEKITSTAEHAWALLLALLRRIPAASRTAASGRWPRNAFLGHQLSGKTLGVVGYGRLGRMTARYGAAFGMRVLFCDTAPELAAEAGCRRVSEAELLREADVVTLHIHLDEANRRWLNRDRLAAMRPGAVLVNTSRGGIVDEAALVDALNSGRLGGAALDVIDGEWDADLARHPLVRYAAAHDNLLLTPHCGGATVEAQQETLGFIARKLLEFLRED